MGSLWTRQDKNGRDIGYMVPATCDHEGCNQDINRGLSFACGGLHGEDEYGCDKYYCSEHLNNVLEDGGQIYHICDDCTSVLLESEEWVFDDDGALVRV